jgi:hypothetical protein
MNMIFRHKAKWNVASFEEFASLASCHATETPLIHDGAHTTLSTAADFRNSSLTGTTLAGPSGSGQFCAVVLSTTVVATVQLPSTVTGQFRHYGIIQNKPRGGDAADVGIFGISKAIAGSTAITFGGEVQLSSTSAGTLVPFSSAAGTTPCGRAVADVPPSAVGALFTMLIYGASGAPGGV